MKAVGRFETLAGVVLLTLTAAIAGLLLLGKPRPLAVVAASPRPGAVEVPVETQLTITFSRPVEAVSVQTGLSVAPPTDGLVSVAGRLAAFTPKRGLRADTDYLMTLGIGVRDRTGRPLSAPVVIRFHTRGQRLVVRTGDGRLLRATLAGATELLAGPGVGEFAVSGAGDVSYVLPAEGALVVRPAGPGAARRIRLPTKPARFGAVGMAVETRELEWAPDGRTIGFLGATGDGANRVYVVLPSHTTRLPSR